MEYSFSGFKRKIKKLIQEPIATFLFGAVCSAAIGILFNASGKIDISVLLIFVSIFVVYAFLALKKSQDKLDDYYKRLGLTSLWIYASVQDEKAYKEVSELIYKAKEKIVVVSPYVPPSYKFKPPKGRTEILFKNIEEFIGSLLKKPSEQPLEYIRIIQSEKRKSSYEEIKKDILENESTLYSHCKRLFEKVSNNDSVDIDIRLINPIPSFPSLLIVDNKHIAFGICTKLPENAKEDYGFAGSFVIEDHVGETAKKFNVIINSFLKDSKKLDQSYFN